MKRRLVKISFAVIAAFGIFLGLLVVLTRDWGPEMSFRFLDGKTLTARIREDPGRSAYRTTHEVYSFEGDIKDVWEKVDAELSALGFKLAPSVGGGPFEPWRYQLRNATNARAVVVSIRDRQKLEVYSTPKSSDYSSPDRYDYHLKDGWVSIEVSRSRLRSWPPQYFLIRLQLMLQRNAGTPSVKK